MDVETAEPEYDEPPPLYSEAMRHSAYPYQRPSELDYAYDQPTISEYGQKGKANELPLADLGRMQQGANHRQGQPEYGYGQSTSPDHGPIAITDGPQQACSEAMQNLQYPGQGNGQPKYGYNPKQDISYRQKYQSLRRKHEIPPSRFQPDYSTTYGPGYAYCQPTDPTFTRGSPINAVTDISYRQKYQSLTRKQEIPPSRFQPDCSTTYGPGYAYCQPTDPTFTGGNPINAFTDISYRQKYQSLTRKQEIPPSIFQPDCSTTFGPGYAQCQPTDPTSTHESPINAVTVNQPQTVTVAPVINQPIPKTYLSLAYFSWCFFWPTGITAVVCSMRAESAIEAKNYEEARQKGDASLILSLVSIMVGISAAVFIGVNYGSN